MRSHRRRPLGGTETADIYRDVYVILEDYDDSDDTTS